MDAQRDALRTPARQYTTNIGSVEDTVWQAALEAGWTDDQLTELPVHVTLNLPTHYFNPLTETEPNLPTPPPLLPAGYR